MNDRQAIHLALPEPRAAATVALLTGRTLDRTLYELRTLEERGAVRSFVDEGSVVRWVQAEAQGPWPWMPPNPPF